MALSSRPDEHKVYLKEILYTKFLTMFSCLSLRILKTGRLESWGLSNKNWWIVSKESTTAHVEELSKCLLTVRHPTCIKYFTRLM